MDDEQLHELRILFYDNYGDWAAHNNAVGIFLGFTLGGTGNDFLTP